ncbi:MAG: histidine kinase [Roseburia sp.]|nr:histidine kinase [Roseburia sp.]
MKKHFFGIQKKFLVYYAMLIVMAATVFAVIIWKMIGNEQETIKNQYISVTENILIKFDSFYDKMDDMTENIILDSYVQSILPKLELSLVESEHLEKIIAYNNNNAMPYYFVNSIGKSYSIRNVSVDKEEYLNSILYRKLNADYAKLHFVWSGEDIFDTGTNNLYVCRNIHSLEKDQNAAQIFFEINDELIEDIMPSDNGLEQIYMIFSDDGEICFEKSGTGMGVDAQTRETVHKILTERKIETNRDTLYMIETAEGILCAGYHAATGFTVVTFVPSGVADQLLRETVRGVLLVLMTGLAAAFLLSINVSANISKPIQKIAGIMDSFGIESLDSYIEISTNTELDLIGNSYNVMVGNIKDLVNIIKEKEKEMRMLEMESLMYQINPHFLYNTLDNVYMMARINKQNEIMNMVDALSKLLRITLSNGRDVISVKQELEHACAYMKIQQVRNSDLFTYKVMCEEELFLYVVPKMILQPLIENCIEHGFADLTEGGQIEIAIREEGEKLLFEVSNNGDVMDHDTLERMNRMLQSGDAKWKNNSSKTGGGYGVGNVVRRLKLKYAEAVSMKYIVESDRTVCRIEFAVKALSEENVV